MTYPNLYEIAQKVNPIMRTTKSPIMAKKPLTYSHLEKNALRIAEIAYRFLYVSARTRKEFDEIFADFVESIDKGAAKLSGKVFGTPEKVTLIDQIDAHIDMLYFLFGNTVAMGIQPYKALDNAAGIYLDRDNALLPFVLRYSNQIVSDAKTYDRNQIAKENYDYYDMVHEFHTVFEHPIGQATVLQTTLAKNRLIYYFEEVLESLQVTAADVTTFQKTIESIKSHLTAFKAHSDAVAQNMDEPSNLSDTDKLIPFAVETRIAYQLHYTVQFMLLAFGAFAEMDIDPLPFFSIVHEANMDKVGIDGKPIYDLETGKVLKREGWQAPEPKLHALLDEILNSKN